jgi:hypothetical protein
MVCYMFGYSLKYERLAYIFAIFFYRNCNYYNEIIKPIELLEDEEQLKKLYEAIEIVESFETALINNDLLEEF